MNKIYTWIIIVTAALGIFLAGCNKAPSGEGKSGPLIEMAGDAVKAHLDENFIIAHCYQLTHRNYLLPTRSWVTERLVPYWFGYLTKNNLMYNVNSTSCEAFAFQCHFASQEIEKANVTVGVFFYLKQGVKNHAINVILINEDDRVKAVFFDPQSNQFVNITKPELESCRFWYF